MNSESDGMVIGLQSWVAFKTSGAGQVQADHISWWYISTTSHQGMKYTLTLPNFDYKLRSSCSGNCWNGKMTLGPFVLFRNVKSPILKKLQHLLITKQGQTKKMTDMSRSYKTWPPCLFPSGSRGSIKPRVSGLCSTSQRSSSKHISRSQVVLQILHIQALQLLRSTQAKWAPGS